MKIRWLVACLALASLDSFSKDSLPDMGVISSGFISLAKEERFGKAIKQKIITDKSAVDDYLLNSYLNNLGTSLYVNSESSHLPISYLVVDKPSLNAFATIGGNIVIYAPLFLATGSESELAAVLAHEIVHVNQRHVVRTLEDISKKNTLLFSTLAGGLLLAIAAPIAGISSILAASSVFYQDRMNYSREHESEADALGMEILRKTGFNSNGYVDFFYRLYDMSYQGRMPEVLSTHPLPKSRIIAARNSVDYSANYNISSEDKDSYGYDYSKAKLEVLHSKVKPNKIINKYSEMLEDPDISKREEALYIYSLSLSYNKSFSPELALEYLNKINPDLISSNLFLIESYCDVLFNLKRYDNIITYLNSIKYLWGYNYLIYHKLVDAYIAMNRNKEALKLMLAFYNNTKSLDHYMITKKKLIKLFLLNDREYDYYRMQADLYFNLGYYSKAINALNAAIKISTDVNLRVQSDMLRLEEIIKERDKMQELSL